MNVNGKVWGETSEIFRNGNVSVNVLTVKGGAYCSRHLHQRKANFFFVLSGEVEVHVASGAPKMDRTRLSTGESVFVVPGVVHRFVGVAPVSVVIEIYEAKLVGEDIDRLDSGGENFAATERDGD